MPRVKNLSQEERIRMLDQASDGPPIAGTVDVAIPADTLWDCFSKADLWPKWNDCFFWVRNRELVLGETLVWAFEPIKPWYLYRMPAWASIVELEPARRVTWEVKAVPGMYARHTYSLEDLGGGRTRFGSWEKAVGPGYRTMGRFWNAHFWFVNRESLAGARRLERAYRADGNLDDPRRLRDA